MTDSTEELRTDGGDVAGDDASPFDTVSEYEETRRDKLQKTYDTYLYTPISIIWTDWRARIGFLILLTYVLMGVLGPQFVAETQVLDGEPYTGPFETLDHPLGTDRMGRDLFAQTIYSTSTILKMITAGALSTVGIGTVVGAVAGYKGGLTDTVLSSITDVFINIPGFPLVMVLALMYEEQIIGNPWAVGLLLSVAAWGGLARSIRSQVLTLRQEEFVEASRSLGVPTRTIVSKDILPHLMPFVVINLTNSARRVIFEAVALYYLGVLSFENLNWGSVLNLAEGANAHTRPDLLHWFLVPIIAIITLSMGLILLGQSLDRVFNPRVRARHERTTGDVEGEINTENNR